MAPSRANRLADAFRQVRVRSDNTVAASKREIQPGIWLDSRLAVWFAPERVLAVADPHWGYAASHRARGNLLPDWGDEVIASTLASLLRDYSPAEMIWVGDVVHAAEGADAVGRYLAAAPVRITVLAGNHDRRWTGAAQCTTTRGRYFFHHGDVERETPQGCIAVIGHHHPAAIFSDGAGGSVKLPALVADAERLILPAFSPWAAGADCHALAGPQSTIWAIAPSRIFALPDSNRISTAL